MPDSWGRPQPESWEERMSRRSHGRQGWPRGEHAGHHPHIEFNTVTCSCGEWLGTFTVAFEAGTYPSYENTCCAVCGEPGVSEGLEDRQRLEQARIDENDRLLEAERGQLRRQNPPCRRCPYSWEVIYFNNNHYQWVHDRVPGDLCYCPCHGDEPYGTLPVAIG